MSKIKIPVSNCFVIDDVLDIYFKHQKKHNKQKSEDKSLSVKTEETDPITLSYGKEE